MADTVIFSDIHDDVVSRVQPLVALVLETKRYSSGKVGEWIDSINSQTVEILKKISPNFNIPYVDINADMNIIKSLAKGLSKGSSVPKVIVPDFIDNMLKPLQNITVYNQHEIDICKGNLLMKCREWKNTHRFGEPSKEDMDKFYQEIQDSDIETLKSNLQDSLCSQIEQMFENIDDIVEEMEGVPSEQYGEELANKLIQRNGFTLEVKKSNIPQAKLGVFIRGTYIHPGNVVAMFPGKVHLPQYLTNEYVDNNLLPDPDYYLMARMDGTIIDGRTAHQTPYNPYGQAHMVNHPPRFTEPNVLQLMFDFPGDPWGLNQFPLHLQKYIPNLYAKKPTLIGTPDRSACMRTVVLVASKIISPGEELVMDYRLNPDVEVPSWYVHVDEDHSRKRWEKPYY